MQLFIIIKKVTHKILQKIFIFVSFIFADFPFSAGFKTVFWSRFSEKTFQQFEDLWKIKNIVNA